MTYLSAIGGVFSIVIIGLFLIYNGAGVYSSIWLSQWTDDTYLKDSSNVNTTEYKNKNYMYLGVYAGLGVGQGIVYLCFCLLHIVSLFKTCV